MANQKVGQSSAEPEPRVFYGYIVVAAAFFLMVLLVGTFMTFGVFFKPILTEFGWTRAVTSGAFSLNWIVQGFLTIFVGRFNDRLGPRIVVTVCISLLGLGYLLMSQINALWQLYFLYAVVMGAGMSGTFVPLASTVARWFVKRRGMMTGVFVAGTGIGGFITPPIANWLIATYDWRVSFIILGSAVLVIGILVTQLLKRDPTQVGQRPYGENEEETGLNLDAEGFSLREAIPTRQFWLISGMFVCLGFCMYVVTIHLVPHATDLGFSAATAANILATTGGASVIGRLLLGSATDKIGSKQVFMIGFALLVAALFWLLPAAEVWKLYLFAAVFGFATGGCVMSQSTIVAGLFGLKSHGLILGAIAFGYCFGSAAGPFVAGYIFDVTSSYQLAFLLSAALSAIGLILSALVTPMKKAGFPHSGAYAGIRPI